MKKIILSSVLAAALLFSSCTAGGGGAGVPSGTDREGNAISLPGRIDRIIVMGPSNVEIVAALGAADKIAAIDSYSVGIPGVPADIPVFDMLSPDGERMAALAPDAIFITGMSKVEGDDPLRLVADSGICVAYIPNSPTIGDIMEDIRFLAKALGAEEKGEALIAGMQSEIDIIRETAGQAVTKKTVYFEISAAPFMYSFGSGTFLNEMIEIAGAENIFAGHDSWLAVTDEAVPQANPDVILTSVDYLDDPVAEILSRPGWAGIAAVQNADVYRIDADASSRPSHNIVTALRQIAEAVHPELFK
ncbi:MAG: ABC transporter substrate-binding protein [Oscillospiraceae bacterium]|nr:ABC transporter substrate-binding protein [Oscillospiraceae bacterium]